MVRHDNEIDLSRSTQVENEIEILCEGSKMLSRATGPLGSSFNAAADFTSSSERTTFPLAPASWS
jgi:hypothetical protein